MMKPVSCILHDDLKVCVPIAAVPYKKALHLYRRTSHGQRHFTVLKCSLWFIKSCSLTILFLRIYSIAWLRTQKQRNLHAAILHTVKLK